ncbi:MAG: adenosylcobinamide amidohydrolase [Sciscionella sp.]
MSEPERRRAQHRPVLVWRRDVPWLAASSAAHGGGIGERSWVLNATVESGYQRDDPETHIGELAAELGLRGRGIGLLTAVDVREAVTVREAGITATVTTGVSLPVWAASAESSPAAAATSERAGTINVVCLLPVRLSEGALVNAVATVAEAKAQALFEAALPGTGTCTDATVLLCPMCGPAEAYGGPRSVLGAPLARCVRAAISAGLPR